MTFLKRGPAYAFPNLVVVPSTTNLEILGNLIVYALVKVTSLVFVPNNLFTTAASNSGVTPNRGVVLNVVPSSIVPNLLPTAVEYSKLIILAIGATFPEFKPVILCNSAH